MAFGGTVYASVNARVSTLELDKKETTRITTERDRQIATQIQALQDGQVHIMDVVDEIKATVKQSDNKMNLLLSGVRKDSVRWNEEMDRFSKQAKK